MGKMRWPGDSNDDEDIRFRFACEEEGCNGKQGFYAVWDLPPDKIPSGMPCPFGPHPAEWILGEVAHVHVVGGDNPHYSAPVAASEHRWMELQIEEAKKAVDGDDQLTGKAASPYAKKVPNLDMLEKQGRIKRDDTETAEQRQRLRDERAKQVADQAKDKIDREIERKHVGNRHDG